MPTLGSLLLEVFDDDRETLLWEVSTSSDHVNPYMKAPKNYEAPLLDPITGATTLTTVEVTVIDAHRIPGDQSTGWMTQRVGNLRGHRCRLRRYISAAEGWFLVADGPAGNPLLDESYSGYRWPIRDARESERKLSLFRQGGSSAIFPRGPLRGFGRLTDDTWLLPPVTPMIGVLRVVDINHGLAPNGIIGQVELSPFTTFPLAKPEYIVTEDMAKETIANGGIGYATFRSADVLWRIAGDTGPWNVSRPRIPENLAGGWSLIQSGPAEFDGESVNVGHWIIVFWDDEIPAQFPAAGTEIEVIVRHRGEASVEFPFYWDGILGDFLSEIYTGNISRGITTIGGSLYDPADMEEVVSLLAGTIDHDPVALLPMTSPVLLRQTEPVEDARSWTESALYAPSGWIPALDSFGRVSPVSRVRPPTSPGLTIVDESTEPSPDWNAGEQVVTSVRFTYHRFFKPVLPLTIATEADGIAVRTVEVTYRDPEAEARERGEFPIVYTAEAFSAIGDGVGGALIGDTEPGAILAQEARYEVLQRYRDGAQAIRVRILRSDYPQLRAGAWVRADISWFPNTDTGLRGLIWEAAQVLSIDDSENVWRKALIEQAAIAQTPGYFSNLSAVTEEDVPSAGYFSTLTVTSDAAA